MKQKLSKLAFDKEGNLIDKKNKKIIVPKKELVKTKSADELLELLLKNNIKPDDMEILLAIALGAFIFILVKKHLI